MSLRVGNFLPCERPGPAGEIEDLNLLRADCWLASKCCQERAIHGQSKVVPSYIHGGKC